MYNDCFSHAKTSLEFIIRRLFRIYPPYWFSLFITGIVIISLKLLRGVNSVAVLPKTGYEIFSTLGLATYPFTKVAAINWVYWTLPYEVLFYLAIILCSFLKNNYITLLLILITVVSCTIPSTNLGFSSFFKFWPLFSIGTALFKLLHDDKTKQLLNVLLFGLSVFAFYPAHQSLPFFITSILTIGLIIISHYKPLSDNLVSRLGDYSYSIYLIHVPLTAYSFGIYRNAPPVKSNVLLNPLLDVILLVVVVYLSRTMYKFVELPSINFGKKLSKMTAIHKQPAKASQL
ncbi:MULTISPECIES: acyltransferase family protein [unclassified Mucilaginibacter]|uniref:acyltransferase family protein n=1 Tax=unclassified Mucilaginibacter TaxID=2617802 RepID=UPI003396AC6D